MHAVLFRVPHKFSPSLHLLRTRFVVAVLVQRLLGYYGRIRLLQTMRHGLRLRLSMPFSSFHQTAEGLETSRLPLREFPYMPGSWTSWRPVAARAFAASDIAFRSYDSVGPPNQVFRRSTSGLHVPLSTLHRRPRDRRCMTRGKRGSLLLRHRVSSTPAL